MCLPVAGHSRRTLAGPGAVCRSFLRLIFLRLIFLRPVTLVTIAGLLFASPLAHARMGLIVGEPFGSFGTMMPQGHASIYLADLCVETAIHLRPCRPGEPGAVISRYHDLRHPELDWMAFPLPVFLYGSPFYASQLNGSQSASTTPPFMTAALEEQIRSAYRRQFLSEYIPDVVDRHGRSQPTIYGDWAEGIGSAFDRRLLMYTFDTTAAQDAAMLSWLNDRPNHRSYTLARHNCADFAADLLRLALPSDVLRRNVPADFDMTTPKTLAREVDRYGHAHPELHLAVYDIPQLPGSLRRSRPIRGAAESLLTNHYYLTTLLVIQPEIILADAIIYEKRGKFHIGDDARTLRPEEWPLPSPLLAKTATLPSEPASPPPEESARSH